MTIVNAGHPFIAPVSRLRAAAALAFLAAALSVGVSSGAQAQIVNGSFESPFAPNWTPVGFATRVTSSFGKPVPSGTNQAFMDNDLTNGAVSTAALEAGLGLTSGSLNTLSASHSFGTVINGSGLEQTFTGSTSSTISFTYDFLTAEDPQFSPHNDFAFVFLRQGSTIVTLQSLASLADATNSLPITGNPSPSVDDYLTDTGYRSFSFILPTTGTYTLGFGVVNVTTNDIVSGLLVDSVSLGVPAVTSPEPASGALAAVFLGAAGAVRVRRRRRSREHAA